MTVVGRYTIWGEIGAGGMATVHLGKLNGPAGFSRLVAVKRLRDHLRNEVEVVTMLRDEARVAASIRHPNVVPVIDVVDDGPELLLVMEYIDGVPLSLLVREQAKPTPTPIAAAIACDVLAGLHAAHEARGVDGEPLAIIHRDVSPQNVLVGVDGVARVADFGVAKARGRAQATTKAGQVKGKLAYMAPEQLRGETLTRHVDVWAVGVVLWEMLTGERLFGGERTSSAVDKILVGEIAPPSTVVPGIAASLDAVVLRALARAPTERFANAREMELALRRSVSVASPPTVGEWVTGLAMDALDQRKRLVDAASSNVSPSTPPTAIERTPVRRSKRAFLIAAAIVAFAIVAGALAVVLRAPSAQTTESAPPASSAEPSTTTTVEPPPTIANTNAPVSSGSSNDRPSRIEPSRAKRPPPRPARADCEPPYVVNAQGEKVYKRECFAGGN